MVSDLIYWNDTDIPNVSVAGNNPSPKNNSHLHPIYSQGILSNINGRKFAQSFGDARSLDTWTFIKLDPVIKNAEITLKSADLEVTSISSNKYGLIEVGDSWKFTTEIHNQGPSEVLASNPAIYRLYVSDGIELGTNLSTIEFNSSCGTIIGQPKFENNYFEVLLELPVGCKATLSIPAVATGPLATYNGKISVWSTIMRPLDYHDADATSSDLNQLPDDPFYEAIDMKWSQVKAAELQSL